jgi:enoyl-CoA hydratase
VRRSSAEGDVEPARGREREEHSADELMPAVMETAQAICDNAPLSILQAKKSIHNGLQMDLKRGFMFEIEAYNRLVDTEDRREGVLAFNEKRKPRFKGQ